MIAPTDGAQCLEATFMTRSFLYTWTNSALKLAQVALLTTPSSRLIAEIICTFIGSPLLSKILASLPSFWAGREGPLLPGLPQNPKLIFGFYYKYCCLTVHKPLILLGFGVNPISPLAPLEIPGFPVLGNRVFFVLFAGSLLWFSPILQPSDAGPDARRDAERLAHPCGRGVF